MVPQGEEADEAGRQRRVADSARRAQYLNGSRSINSAESTPESSSQSSSDRKADPSTQNPASGSFRFRKSQHLRRGADFERVYERKCRAGDDVLLVFADHNDLKVTRIGLSVSKKHGCAVRRNRLKRLLREAFRLCQHELPTGLDLVLIPRQGEQLTLERAQRSLISSIGILRRKLLRHQ